MKKNRRNEGFSFIESLSAILIFSILNIAAFAFVKAAFSNLKLSKSLSDESLKILEADRIIRKEILKIKFPYWKKEISLDESLKSKIYSFFNEEDFKILDIYQFNEENKNKLAVEWSYKKKSLKTISELSLYLWGQYEISK